MKVNKDNCKKIQLFEKKKTKEKTISFYIHNDMEMLQIGSKTTIKLRYAYLMLYPKNKGLSDEQLKLSFELIYDKEYILICNNEFDHYEWINKISYYTNNIGLIGYPLNVAIRKTGLRIPYPIYRCIEYLEKNNAFDHEGIFRKSACQEDIEYLANIVQHDNDISMEDLKDCFVAASFLKYCLGKMVEPLIPFELYKQFLLLNQGNIPVKSFISMMPEPHQNVLWFITKFLNKIIQNKEVNKMNEYNIATCIALTVCKPPFDKMDCLTETRNIIESFYYILCHFKEAFEEIEKRNETMTFPEYPAFNCPCPEISCLIENVKSTLKEKSLAKSIDLSSVSSSKTNQSNPISPRASPRFLSPRIFSQKRGDKIRINPPESQKHNQTDEMKEEIETKNEKEIKVVKLSKEEKMMKRRSRNCGDSVLNIEHLNPDEDKKKRKRLSLSFSSSHIHDSKEKETNQLSVSSSSSKIQRKTVSPTVSSNQPVKRLSLSMRNRSRPESPLDDGRTSPGRLSRSSQFTLSHEKRQNVIDSMKSPLESPRSRNILKSDSNN